MNQTVIFSLNSGLLFWKFQVKFERVDMFQFLQTLIKVKFCFKAVRFVFKWRFGKKIKKVKLNRKEKIFISKSEDEKEDEKKLLP